MKPPPKPRTVNRRPITTCRLTLAAAWLAIASTGFAQAPAGGVLGSAIQGFQTLNAEGPGLLYYGINAADRGLGYNGSYMTLGGFIPMAEDDLGGFWAADLRGHLSEYGGFFSNVGAVRKQFVGGTLLGIGVYWDYDGDQNQYPTAGLIGTERYGEFGHAYNQVGVSAELLTDYGNLRSNGYMPVGTTAHTLGAPEYGFVGNNLLCQYGLDAALSGADLEVGAYIPGLADWAGMISVGGYTLGNANNNWNVGPKADEDVVPWFGGVYTRLDLTFLENWDFSLQANNDSYFDWTGFARITYRMGGSRRRNVPDQMEQPMMRNEHIVRSHQTPILAINPSTGTPWNVIHVDNSAAFGGDGTAGSPVQTLAAAQTLAHDPYDIVYVRAGKSATRPYEIAWQFGADNQILVGEGSTLALNTATCGYKQFFTGSGTAALPSIMSTGTAITLRNGAVVDHFQIVASDFVATPVAIAADNTLTGTASVNDVRVIGSAGTGQIGVQLVGVPAGVQVDLYNMRVQDTDVGVIVDGGAAAVTFQGLISHADSTGAAIVIQNTTGGTINVNNTVNTFDTPSARNTVINSDFGIDDQGSLAQAAIIVTSNTNTIVNIGQAIITGPTQRGVLVQNNTNTQVMFQNLGVTAAVNEAFTTLSNDTASSVSIDGRSSLASVSSTLPAFDSNDDAVLAIRLESVESAVPLAGPPKAIRLQGASSGTFEITDEFLVSGAPGSMTNVSNATTGTPPATGPVTVTLP